MEKRRIRIKRKAHQDCPSHEGVLIGENGETIYDDSWLHEDVMNNEPTCQKCNKRVAIYDNNVYCRVCFMEINNKGI